MKSNLDVTQIELEQGEAAMVFREDGLETYLTRAVTNAMDDDQVSELSVLCAMVLTITHDGNQDILEILRERFNQRMGIEAIVQAAERQ